MFENLWSGRKFSDCEIVCQPQRFPCHRNILAAASLDFLKRSRKFQGGAGRFEGACSEIPRITAALPPLGIIKFSLTMYGVVGGARPVDNLSRADVALPFGDVQSHPEVTPIPRKSRQRPFRV